MRVLKALWGLGLAAALTIGLVLAMTGGALAAGGTSLCIPTAENQATVTPTAGACGTVGSSAALAVMVRNFRTMIGLLLDTTWMPRSWIPSVVVTCALRGSVMTVIPLAPTNQF